jgi:hypothetical protein
MRLPFLLSAYEKNGTLKLLWQLQKLMPTTRSTAHAVCAVAVPKRACLTYIL